MQTPDGSSYVSAPVADPVVILALPRSFGSLVGAMLGQNPQMYGLPETHLFLADALREWWDLCGQSSFNMAHGLLRVIAQLYFGDQTEDDVQLAGAWLRRRLPFTTGYILELVSERVHPRIIVENSPSVVFHLGSMQRAQRMFPQARFIHLVQHPRSYGESVVAAVKEAASHGSIPQWLLQLACYSVATADSKLQLGSEIDPQRAWHALNSNICQFLEAVPRNQVLRFRGEDILASPRASLRTIANWLGVRSDEGAMEEMEHPERSQYACFGPSSARFGNDPVFLQGPVVPPAPAEPQSLEGSLTWREDGEGFLREVMQLAREFGYE
jgi:sulfotransferase family protein